MTTQEIGDDLAGVPEPQRHTREALRATILGIIPAPEQCISRGMPAFRIEGKVIAGFVSLTKHVAYLPHTGSVLRALSTELAGYAQTKGSLHLPVNTPSTKQRVERLSAVCLDQLGLSA